MFRMGSSYEPHGLFRGRLAGLTPVHDDLPPAPPVSQEAEQSKHIAGGWRGLHMAKTRVTFGRGPDVRAGAGTGHRPARMSRWEGAPPTLRLGPVGGSAFFP